MDRLHENPFVLEHVTLALEVHGMVHVLVDLLCFSVLLQQSTKNSMPSEPKDFRGKSGFTGTSALTVTGVPT